MIEAMEDIVPDLVKEDKVLDLSSEDMGLILSREDMGLVLSREDIGLVLSSEDIDSDFMARRAEVNSTCAKKNYISSTVHIHQENMCVFFICLQPIFCSKSKLLYTLKKKKNRSRRNHLILVVTARHPGKSIVARCSGGGGTWKFTPHQAPGGG